MKANDSTVVLPAPYYEGGGVVLYHADHQDVLPALQPASGALTVTSPPYNINRRWWDTPGPNSTRKAVAAKHLEDWYEDSVPEGEYRAQQRALLERLLQITTAVAYNHKVRYAWKRDGRAHHPMEWIAGLPLWVEIIWDTCGGPSTNTRRPVVGDERIYVLGKPSAWHNLGLTTVWKMLPASIDGHPCAMPLSMAERLIAMFSDPGDLVLDPYAGSGTTLVAARLLGRRAVGIERDRNYCDLAVRRLEGTLPLAAPEQLVQGDLLEGAP